MIISLQINADRMDFVNTQYVEKFENFLGQKIYPGYNENADIIVFSGIPKIGNKVVFMQSLSAGVNHLDFKKIPENIVVSSNADAYSFPVAEHVFALLLSHLRSICTHDYEIKHGVYQRNRYMTLNNMTIGILGYGGIGREVARLGKAFGMKTIGYSRTEHKDKFLDEFSFDPCYVLKRSDINVISLPLNKYTENLIDGEKLEMMKGNILINVGRSNIVKKRDMLDFLNANPEKYFLTDVWWNEPHIEDKIPENVLVTPHMAGGPLINYFDEPLIKAFENVKNFMEGHPKNVVKREDYI